MAQSWPESDKFIIGRRDPSDRSASSMRRSRAGRAQSRGLDVCEIVFQLGLLLAGRTVIVVSTLVSGAGESRRCRCSSQPRCNVHACGPKSCRRRAQPQVGRQRLCQTRLLRRASQVPPLAHTLDRMTDSLIVRRLSFRATQVQHQHGKARRTKSTLWPKLQVCARRNAPTRMPPRLSLF